MLKDIGLHDAEHAGSVFGDIENCKVTQRLRSMRSLSSVAIKGLHV